MDWSAFYAFFGAMVGGLISAIASYFISKKTIKADLEKTQNEIKASLEKTNNEITAKFNIEVKANHIQKWIDQLREKIAEAVLISSNIKPLLNNDEGDVFHEKAYKIINDFNYISAYISLMLNPHTKENELINNLNDLRLLIAKFAELSATNNAVDKVNKDSQFKKDYNELTREIASISNDLVYVGCIILKKEYDKKINLQFNPTKLS